MKTNGNDPASASSILKDSNDSRIGDVVQHYTGLTKREMFAMEFTKSLLSNPEITTHSRFRLTDSFIDSLVEEGAATADKFIKTLNEKAS